MNEGILVRHLNLQVLINEESWLVNWLRQIKDTFYEVGISPMRELNAGSLWLVKIENETIIPVSCTIYYTIEEKRQYDLAQKLKLDLTLIHERILQERIKNEQTRSNDNTSNSN